MTTNIQGNKLSDGIFKNQEREMDFESFYSYLSKLSYGTEISIQKYDNIVKLNTDYSRGSESFKDFAKSSGSMILTAIISAVKAIINWIKRFILYIGRFIRDKLLYKMFGKSKNKWALDMLADAYDRYGNLPITWTGKSTSTESTLEEIILSPNFDEEIPELSSQLKERLRYMNFRKDNFDVINRVSAAASAAVHSIRKTLELNTKTNDILRNYGIVYGDPNDENYYENNRSIEPSMPIDTYFYHEKSFMQFIHYIDLLTNGNIEKLITKRNYYAGKKDYGYTIESKIDLKIDGADVADAILLNCKISDLLMTKRRVSELNPDRITIKDVVSKDVLLKLAGGNNLILDKLADEANKCLEINEVLEKALKNFYDHLEEIDKRLENENHKPIKGFVGIKEAQEWVAFMVKFTNRFMMYRLDMIHVIRRVVMILAKRTNNTDLKNITAKDGTTNNKSLGTINTYTDEKFKSLPYSKLVEEAKYIANKHMKNMYATVKHPVCIIPVKDYTNELGLPEQLKGSARIIYSHQLIKPVFSKINRLLDSNSNDEKAIVYYYKKIMNVHITDPLSEVLGYVILINVDRYKKYKKEYLEYFPLYVNYYGTILHEMTHVIRCDASIKTPKDGFHNVATNNSEIEKELNKERDDYINDAIDNRDRSKYDKFMNIKQNHYLNAYILSNHEAESIKEEVDFILSTLDEKSDVDKKKGKEIFTKQFIYGIHFV
jgi:hypothetical protein